MVDVDMRTGMVGKHSAISDVVWKPVSAYIQTSRCGCLAPNSYQRIPYVSTTSWSSQRRMAGVNDHFKSVSELTSACP